jgi:hypothetical protein
VPVEDLLGEECVGSEGKASFEEAVSGKPESSRPGLSLTETLNNCV